MKKCQLGTLPQFNFRPVGLPPFLLNLWRKIYSWILKGALTLRGSIPTRYYLWRAFLTITFVNNAPWNLSALGYLIFIVLTSKSTIFFFKKFVFGPETQYKRCQRQQINFLLKIAFNVCIRKVSTSATHVRGITYSASARHRNGNGFDARP